MKTCVCLLGLITILFASDTLKIGLYKFPPCVITDGTPTGFDVELFKMAADKAGIPYRFKVCPDFTTMLDNVKQNKLDAAISGITITSEREKVMDFTHPYLNSGLVILAEKNKNVNTLKVLLSYLNAMAYGLIYFFIYIFLCGLFIWAIERKQGIFSTNFIDGVIDGIYWCITTITTVGYGDRYPKTRIGKFFTSIVMLSGIAFIFPYAIASMTSSMAVEIKTNKIESIKDLPGKRVATEAGTTTEEFLLKIGATVVSEKHLEECFKDLEQSKIDAVVFDMPAIKYYLKNGGDKNYTIVGEMFDKQEYGYALQQNSPWRKHLNTALLEIIKSDEYSAMQKKWFGE